MFGLGDAGSDSFDQQLSQFKMTLLDLYKKKAKLVAERESLRFQYLTGFKAQLQALFAAMYNQVFADKNGEGQVLVQSALGAIQHGFPMVTMIGGSLDQWGQPVYNFGGTYNVSFLSPPEHLLALPFNAPDMTDSAYKIYRDTLTTSDTENLLQQYYMGDYVTHVQLPDGQVSFSLPVNTDWLGAWAQTHGADPGQSAYAAGIINGTYNGQNLKALFDQGRTLLGSLIDKTKLLVGIQLQIDDEAAQLADFAAAYRDSYSKSLVISDVLDCLQKAAASGDQLPISQAGSCGTTVASANVPPANATTVATPAPPQSKTWLYLAAAAGIFLLTKGNK